MNISLLADHPEFIETLAPWVAKHWRPILTHTTAESCAAKFQTHLNSTMLPIAWVAHQGTKVCGTASLRVHDLPGREDLTPWLGGIYVASEFRNRGIGGALCAVAEQQAKSLFGVTTLYLFTLDRQDWYGKLGWRTFEPCTWCGRAGDIMLKELRGA
mgnify:CR=1 FL=1